MKIVDPKELTGKIVESAYWERGCNSRRYGEQFCIVFTDGSFIRLSHIRPDAYENFTRISLTEEEDGLA